MTESGKMQLGKQHRKEKIAAGMEGPYGSHSSAGVSVSRGLARLDISLHGDGQHERAR